jgi:hypothetical protein
VGTASDTPVDADLRAHHAPALVHSSREDGRQRGDVDPVDALGGSGNTFARVLASPGTPRLIASSETARLDRSTAFDSARCGVDAVRVLRSVEMGLYLLVP